MTCVCSGVWGHSEAKPPARRAYDSTCVTTCSGSPRSCWGLPLVDPSHANVGLTRPSHARRHKHGEWSVARPDQREGRGSWFPFVSLADNALLQEPRPFAKPSGRATRAGAGGRGSCRAACAGARSSFSCGSAGASPPQSHKLPISNRTSGQPSCSCHPNGGGVQLAGILRAERWGFRSSGWTDAMAPEPLVPSSPRHPKRCLGHPRRVSNDT